MEIDQLLRERLHSRFDLSPKAAENGEGDVDRPGVPDPTHEEKESVGDAVPDGGGGAAADTGNAGQVRDGEGDELWLQERAHTPDDVARPCLEPSPKVEPHENPQKSAPCVRRRARFAARRGTPPLRAAAAAAAIVPKRAKLNGQVGAFRV